MLIPALSISAPLLQYRHGVSGRWIVHSSFTNVIYVYNSSTDELLALVRRKIGNGPFYILLPDDAPLDLLTPGMPVDFSAGILNAGPLAIDFNGAPWQPELPSDELLIAGGRKSKVFKEILVRIIDDFRAGRQSSGIQQAIQERLYEAAEALVDAMLANELSALPSIVAGLAGLGNGLTPAGDDIILGFCFGLWLAERPEVISLLIPPAMSRTNVISRAFLRAASQRRYTEPWHNLLHAMAAQDQEQFRAAIQRISHFGASSGFDSLTGFLYATLLMDTPHP